MNALFRRSLHVRIVVPAILVLFVAMVAVAYLASMAMEESVRVVTRERAEYAVALAQNSVEDVEHVMMVDHGVKLQTVLERIAANPDLDAVRILSPAGKVLQSSRPGERGTLLPDHSPGAGTDVADTAPIGAPFVKELPEHLHASGPIRNGRRCRVCHDTDAPLLGYVGVDINIERQMAGIRKMGRMAMVAALGQVIVLAVGLGLILQVVAVRPLRALADSMARVQGGSLTAEAAQVTTSEINQLVVGFNDMVGRLRRAKDVEDENQRGHLARVEQLATLGEVSASLAHEIRNPLSGVKAAVDVLAAEQAENETKGILHHISGELSRVDGVIRQLLNYARPRLPVIGPTDLSAVAADVLVLGRPKAASQGAAILGRLTAEPVTVYADVDLLQQIILNLVINALQAVAGRDDAVVTVEVGSLGGRAFCRVKDSGPGVPRERGEEIFRPFVTSKPRGTGLGLATSRRLAELQGGRLVLENPGLAGASFVLSLPMSPQAG